MNKYKINNVNTNPKIPMGLGNNNSSAINRIYGGSECFAFYLDLSAFRIGDKVEQLKIKLRIKPFNTERLSFVMKAKEVLTTYVHSNDNLDVGRTIDQVNIEITKEEEIFFDITEYIQEKINNNELFVVINFYHNCTGSFELLIDENYIEVKDIKDIILDGYVYFQNQSVANDQVVNQKISGASVNCHLPSFLTSLSLPGLSTTSPILPITFGINFFKESFSETINNYGVFGKGFTPSYIYKIQKIEKYSEGTNSYTFPITFSAYELEDYNHRKNIFREVNEIQDMGDGDEVVVQKFRSFEDGSVIQVSKNTENQYNVRIEFLDNGILFFCPINSIEDIQELKIASYRKNGFISIYNYLDDKLDNITVYSNIEKTNQIDKINFSYVNNFINQIEFVNLNKIIKFEMLNNRLISYQIYNKTTTALQNNEKIINLSLTYDEFDNLRSINDLIENKNLYINLNDSHIVFSEKSDYLTGKYLKITKQELLDNFLIKNELNNVTEYQFDYYKNVNEIKEYIETNQENNEQQNDNENIQIQTGRFIENYALENKLTYKMNKQNNINLLQNGDFSNQLVSWEKSEGFSSLINSNDENKESIGDKILELKPNNTIYQEILPTDKNELGLVGQEIFFGIWLKGNITVNNKIVVTLIFNYLKRSVNEETGAISDYTKMSYEFELIYPCFKYFEHEENKFQKIVGMIKAEYVYTNLTIKIENLGYENINIGNVELYKGLNNNYYGYNEYNQLTDIVTSSTETNYIYDEKGKIKTVISDTGIFDYSYNDKKQITKITKRATNVKEQYEYKDLGDLKSKITTDEKGKTNSISYDYDEKNNLKSQTDNFNNITSLSYDDYSNITEIKYPNELKKTNEFYINDLLKLEKKNYEKVIDQNTRTDIVIDKVDYEYDTNNKRLIKTLQVNDNIEYIYNFDESENLLSVTYKEDNESYRLCDYTYKKVNNVTTNLLEIKTYYSSKKVERYKFEYDEYYRINKITYGIAVLNEETIITDEDYVTQYINTFIYDNQNRLIEIYKNDELVVECIYDNNNRIKQYIRHCIEKTPTEENEDDASSNNENASTNIENKIITMFEQYEYDNLSNLQSKIININDEENTYYYDYPFESQTDNFYSFLMRISKYNLNDSYIATENKKSFYGADDFGNIALFPYNDNIKMRTIRIKGGSINKYLEFNYDDLNKEKIDNNVYGNLVYKKSQQIKNQIAIYLFVKQVESYSHNLITLLDNNDNELVKVYLQSGRAYLDYSTQAEINNDWNLIALVVEENCIRLSVNGLYYQTKSETINISEVSKIRIGEKNNINNYITDIAYINMGNQSLEVSTLARIYEEAMKYLNKEYIYPFSGVRYYNKKTYQKFDIFSLNGTLKSISGIEPYKYLYNDNYNKSTKQQIFKYDEELNRYIYGSYDSSIYSSPDILIYKMKLAINGTFTIRFKPEMISGTRNIIVLESENQNIRILINSNNQLVANINGTIKILGSIVRQNNWNTLFVTYGSSFIKVKLNNYNLINVTENNISIDTNEYFKLYLGCYVNNLNEPVDHLNGKLEMFGYSDSVLEESEMKNIIENGGLYGVSNKYDTSSRIIEKIISSPDNNLSTKYRYVEDSKFNPYITSEIQPDNEEIIYEYDKMGNIIKILKLKQELYSFQLNSNSYQDLNYFKQGIQYEYDIFNRLKKETYFLTPDEKTKEIEYEYNEFGNISSKTVGGTIYNYSYEKGMLTKISRGPEDSSEILYSIEYDNMYPKKIEKNNTEYELDWENKKLIKYGNILFEYDEEGQRIKKITPNKTVEYVYLNGTIIRSISYTNSTPNITTIIDYNYDESGQLIGLSYNNQQYFYIRDILGNINKIIDKNGNVMVLYSYDGYGNPTISATGNIQSILLSNNIFLYKGYCYDVETGLFWLSSRYYSPELCRFISPDDIDYLDPESVNGLNLYCYCLNNPISYADPSGHFVITTAALLALGKAMLIGGLIAAGTAYGVDVVTNFSDGFELSDFNTFTKENLIEYACAFTGGAISGALGSFGNTGLQLLGTFVGEMVENAYSFTSWENVGQALIMSVFSTTLDGVLTVGKNRLTRSYFEKGRSNLSTKANKQIKKFLNKGIDPTNVHASDLINRTYKYYNRLDNFTGTIHCLLTL